jgi:hypothetical protein
MTNKILQAVISTGGAHWRWSGKIRHGAGAMECGISPLPLVGRDDSVDRVCSLCHFDDLATEHIDALRPVVAFGELASAFGSFGCVFGEGLL